MKGNGNYTLSTSVRDNDKLRASFNELTSKTFGFDFIGWYQAGHWGNMYLPHVLLDGDKVVSNVSVNLMQFVIGGEIKNYIQLGTVMTDEAYRGLGLNRRIVESILEEYRGKVDGIYLFGNDSVLEYYPKFGFQAAKEYEYYMECTDLKNQEAYQMQKVDLTDSAEAEKLYDFIRKQSDTASSENANDGFYMNENIGLYQFWLAAEFGESIYYLQESGGYVAADLEDGILHVHQIWGGREVEMNRLAKAFGEDVRQVVLEYTPACRDTFSVREYHEEDSTLFIIGEDLKRIEKEQLRFPVMSHA